jgi:hypothetical protein
MIANAMHTINALMGFVSPMVSLLYRLGRDYPRSRFWQVETLLQCDMIGRKTDMAPACPLFPK